MERLVKKLAKRSKKTTRKAKDPQQSAHTHNKSGLLLSQVTVAAVTWESILPRGALRPETQCQGDARGTPVISLDALLGWAHSGEIAL